jgi:hypothetical protein
MNEDLTPPTYIESLKYTAIAPFLTHRIYTAPLAQMLDGLGVALWGFLTAFIRFFLLVLCWPIFTPIGAYLHYKYERRQIARIKEALKEWENR